MLRINNNILNKMIIFVKYRVDKEFFLVTGLLKTNMLNL